MTDLEQALRRTLSARVSHLTAERLDADVSVPEPPRRTWRTVALPLAAAATVAAVTAGVMLDGKPRPGATPNSRRLVGIEWQLTSIGAHAVPDGVDATIRFDGAGNASGNDGCNQFGGSVTIDGSVLRFGEIGVTDMYCSGSRGDVEAQFTAAIRSIDHWTLSGGRLRLTGRDGTVLTFHAG